MSSELTEYQGGRPEAIQRQYDVGTDFYRLWLDTDMTYSCALWTDGDDLDRAQLRKLDYLINKARIAGSDHVLDIECGWGSLMRRIAERHERVHITGITLSQEQHDFVKKLSTDRMDVRLEHWSAHHPEYLYDAIFCVGALEHFVRAGLSQEDRTSAYRNFFAHSEKILQPGGALVVQTIGKGNRPLDQEALEDLFFIMTEVFPSSDPPRLSELCHAAEKLFEVRSVVNHRLDYAKTCAEWLRRLQSCRHDAIRIAGDHTTNRYERYLKAAVRQFEQDHTALYRILFRKVANPPSPAA